MENKRQPWEIVVFVLAGILLTCWLASCGINHETQRVLTNEAARNHVGRIWADLHPCAVDSIVHYKSDTTIMRDTTSFVMIDTVTDWKRDTLIRTIREIRAVHDTVKITKIDVRALNALKSDTAYYKGQIAEWKDRAAEYKKSANKWLWSFIGACIASAIGIGLYLRSVFTKFPNFIKK